MLYQIYLVLRMDVSAGRRFMQYSQRLTIIMSEADEETFRKMAT
jgi:hypothetical protein